MNQRHHVRTGSQGRKVQALVRSRPLKPPPLGRRQASQTQIDSLAPPSSPCTTHSRRGGHDVRSDLPGRADEQEDAEMASFPQFCATCEKLIVTPDISILYCSQACRRGDMSRSTAQTPPHSPLLASRARSVSDQSQVDIIPQRSPTIVRPFSFTSGYPFPDLPIHVTAGQPHLRSAAQDTAVVASSPPSTARFSLHRKSTDANIPSLVHSPSSSYGTAGSGPGSTTGASYRSPIYHKHSGSHTATVDVIPPFPIVTPSSPIDERPQPSFKSPASISTSFRVVEAVDWTVPASRSHRYQRFNSTERDSKVLLGDDAESARTH